MIRSIPVLAGLLIAAGGCSKPADRTASLPWRIETNGKILPPENRPTFAADWDRRSFSHELWNGVLRDHVTDAGLVDYEGIGRDARYSEYLRRLSASNPRDLPDNKARLAFWINAYNSLTIQGVLATLDVDKARWPNYRINEVKIGNKGFWQGLQFLTGESWHTLDQIEHEILRKGEGLRDPRIHLALVCAARGCPPLWNRAYTADQVDQQLADRVRRFAADPERCRFDRQSHVIRTARIFEWYGQDFVSREFSPRADSIPRFLASYVTDRELARLLENEAWQVTFVEYDWRLNLKP